jgi:hypothetical protein
MQKLLSVSIRVVSVIRDKKSDQPHYIVKAMSALQVCSRFSASS